MSNEKTIENYLDLLRSLPEQISDIRLKTIKCRLTTISKILKHKPFDDLTEADIKHLNIEMKKRKMVSAPYYRKALKRYWRFKDKKKFIDLIESPFMSNRRVKTGKRKLVDASEFWTEEENAKYIEASKNYSNKQHAWAVLWIATGCRPHELLALRKESFVYDTKDNSLVIRIESKKQESVQ